MRAVFRISLLSQRNTVVLRRLAILLSVLPVEAGVPAFGPVGAIAAVVGRGQELRPIQVALPAVGRVTAGVGRGIARVSGVQYRLGFPHTVGKRSLPRRHGRLAPSQVSLTLRLTHSHAANQPPADARDTPVGREHVPGGFPSPGDGHPSQANSPGGAKTRSTPDVLAMSSTCRATRERSASAAEHTLRNHPVLPPGGRT